MVYSPGSHTSSAIAGAHILLPWHTVIRVLIPWKKSSDYLVFFSHTSVRIRTPANWPQISWNSHTSQNLLQFSHTRAKFRTTPNKAKIFNQKNKTELLYIKSISAILSATTENTFSLIFHLSIWKIWPFLKFSRRSARYVCHIFCSTSLLFLFSQ